MIMDSEHGLDNEVDDRDTLVRRAPAEDAGQSLPPPRRRGLASALVHIARGRWSRANNAILASSRVVQLADEDQKDFQRENQEDQALHGDLQVCVEVREPRDLAAINYVQQGASDMYCEDQVTRRDANRSDPALLEAVRCWWLWLPKVQPGTPVVVVAQPSQQQPHHHQLEQEQQEEERQQQRQQQKQQKQPHHHQRQQEQKEEGRQQQQQENEQKEQQQQQHEQQEQQQQQEPEGGKGRIEEGMADGEAAAPPLSQAADVAAADSGPDDAQQLGGEMATSSIWTMPSREGLGEDGEGGAVYSESGSAGGGVDVQVAALDQPVYSAMVVAITWVLLPRFGITSDPEYDPSGDWVDDSAGLPHMDFPHFFDAMFDLADMWSIGVDAIQYVDLLESVLRDVQQLEAREAAFTRLLQKFRGRQQPPPSFPQQPDGPTPQLSPQASSDPYPDPRLPPPGTATGAVAGTAPISSAWTVPAAPTPPFKPSNPAQSSSSHLATVHRVSGSRGESPADGGSSVSRRDAFRLPHFSRVDVSGIRSTLADYLRNASRRPDPATLEEWRRNRRRGRREGSTQAGGSGVRGRAPAAVAMGADMLAGAVGGRDGNDGGVLMYEEYMHDLAARYLAHQEKVLVATSASAAAAAGQLLAAAGWEGAEAVLTRGEQGGGATEGAGGPDAAATSTANQESAAAAAPPDSARGGDGQTPPVSTAAGSSKAPAVASSGPAAPGSYRSGRGGGDPARVSTSSPIPGLMPPPPLPPLIAPTIDLQLLEYMQPVCVVGHAVQTESGAGGAGSIGPDGSRVARGPFRRPSQSTAPGSLPTAGGWSSGVQQPPPAVPPLPMHTQAAATPTSQPGSFTQRSSLAGSGAGAKHVVQQQQPPNAAAQAQVVVAFAAAAYRLADPNVHALLLPARHPNSPGPLPPHTHTPRSHNGSCSSTGSPPYSPSGRRARPPTAAAAAGQHHNHNHHNYQVGPSMERFAPYMGPAAAAALSYIVPHIASDGDGDVRSASGDADAGHSGPAAAWPPTQSGDAGNAGGRYQAAAPPSPPATPDTPRTLSHSSMPLPATPAGALGGVIARRLASARNAAAGAPAVARSVWPSNHPAPPPHNLPDSLQLPPHQPWDDQHPCQQALASPTMTSAALSSPTGPVQGGGGSGGAGLSSRWVSAPSSPGLSQTPRSSLRPSSTASSGHRATNGAAVAPGSGAGSGSVGGSSRRFSGAPGGSPAGGVILPNAAMSNKLRTFYSSSPVSLVTQEGALALPHPYTLSPGTATPASSGEDHHNPNSGLPSVTGEAPAAEGHLAGSCSVDGRVWRRNSSADYSASGGAPGSVVAVRSPMRIRSSEPVGYSDAVTATRMNVAIMADELTQRQAEQRAHAKMLRKRVLHLRPSTAATRDSYQHSFGAFLAARESGAAMAVGGGVGNEPAGESDGSARLGALQAA